MEQYAKDSQKDAAIKVKFNIYAIGQVGLKGEASNLHTESGSSSVEWTQGSLVAKKQPLTWYKVRIKSQTNDAFLSLL